MTYNPITGCLHGCKYCYAEKIAKRFGQFPCENSNCAICGDCNLEPSYNCNRYSPCERIHELDNPVYTYNPKRMQPYPFGFEPTFHRYRLNEPAKVKKPQKIFVCSMADLFGEWVPDEWIDEVFKACEAAPWHTYMFLTKNPKRYNDAIEMIACEERSFALSEGYWDKFWFGTTITCQDDVERVKNLSKFSEGHKFLSIEPLLSEVKIDLSEYCCPKCNSIYVYQDNPVTTQKGALPFYCEDCGWEGEKPKPLIEFVIIGQQTGPGAKPPKDEWVQSIIDQCKAAGVPIFVKHPLYEKFPIQEWPKGLEVSK